MNTYQEIKRHFHIPRRKGDQLHISTFISTFSKRMEALTHLSVKKLELHIRYAILI